MNKRSLKTAVIFSVLVFIIFTVSALLTVMFTTLLYHIGVFDSRNGQTILIVSAFISVIIGTVLSQIAGKRPIAIIEEISNATKEISKGNFNIQLNENIRATELHEMTHSFNIMARELAGTEILRNDFVENVSHEFKTPLSAIEGYVTLLQKKGLAEERRIEYTERILFNTKRLSALTGNILLLSRLENQEIEIKKECYPLDEQLRETILIYEPQWTQKALDMDIDLNSIYYYGNKELLAQVWLNLLGNAIKFVPDGGRIRILLRQKQTFIEISIADNGIGMNRETLSRIYEKFYQGDPSRASSGNGLGLTLVKRIVDLHKGNINTSSKEGKGTSFIIQLPI